LSTSTRLPGVDGLRAIAALWVVLFHITAFSSAQFPHIPGLDLFLKSGSTGVSLFLVLSGFCLYLPFAGGRTHRFKVREFFRRRAQRLMPAYCVALVLSLALVVATSGLLGLPQLTVGEAVWQTVTHLALIHTLFPDTFYSLNGAFWSLGLEWQLYLALPLLVWVSRRFGLRRAVAFAVACNVVYRLGLSQAVNTGMLDGNSLLAIAVLPNQLPGRWAEFAFGMLAAELHASGQLRRWAHAVPGMLCAIAVLVPLSLVASKFALSHIVYGTLFATLLCVVIASDNRIARTLAWRPLVALGTMSYSLYLVHQPVIQFLGGWLELNRPDLSPTAVFLLLLSIVPLIMLLAWALFLTVERRTLGANAGDILVPRFRVAARAPTSTSTAASQVPGS
jgi:peptidoglycan/LPS O-acetylase OafA/YrhL